MFSDVVPHPEQDFYTPSIDFPLKDDLGGSFVIMVKKIDGKCRVVRNEHGEIKLLRLWQAEEECESIARAEKCHVLVCFVNLSLGRQCIHVTWPECALETKGCGRPMKSVVG